MDQIVHQFVGSDDLIVYSRFEIRGEFIYLMPEISYLESLRLARRSHSLSAYFFPVDQEMHHFVDVADRGKGIVHGSCIGSRVIKIGLQRKSDHLDRGDDFLGASVHVLHRYLDYVFAGNQKFGDVERILPLLASSLDHLLAVYVYRDSAFSSGLISFQRFPVYGNRAVDAKCDGGRNGREFQIGICGAAAGSSAAGA